MTWLNEILILTLLRPYKNKQYKMKKKLTKKTLLKGEGANQHTLYGTFAMEDKPTDFAEVFVAKDSLLRHEQPNGLHAEHETLQVEAGGFVMGKQVEYNPFKRSISQIWD